MVGAAAALVVAFLVLPGQKRHGALEDTYLCLDGG